MIDDNQIVVIIPAYNEEESLPLVLYDIPDFVDEIIVANNGSTDNTYEVAKKAGATVVNEDEKGYGAACLKAMEKIKDEKFDIVVFLDGDYSDYPEEMNLVVEPIV
ncbi:MAG: glycosyltransferase family 2 protein, partial [Chlorobium sp.]|nr:glycosyltransferase family 2 protein [Chlorobium sp.]